MKSPAAGRGAQCDAAPTGKGAPPIPLPLKFLLLVFAFSAPFWLVGDMTDEQWIPFLVGALG